MSPKKSSSNWLLSDVLLPTFLLAYAIFTIVYWIGIFIGASQFIIWLGFGTGCILLRGQFARLWAGVRSNFAITSPQFLTFLLAVLFGAFCILLYSTNPDDTTFYHRIAHTLDIFLPLPTTETRLAFDELPAISPAHLMSSWEYVWAFTGNLVGQPLIGYQLVGSFFAAFLFVAACEQVLRHFFPKIDGFIIPLILLIVVLLVVLDADANRRIGAWLILGGWTGKCFFAALLLLVFPAWETCINKCEEHSIWFLLSLIISLMGLTGSALFVLPLGLGCAFIVTLVWYQNKAPFALALFVVLLPIIIGSIFILRFGANTDISYWQYTVGMDAIIYVQQVVSSRNAIFVAVSGAVLLWAVTRSLTTQSGYFESGQEQGKFQRFLAVQFLISVLVFNPLLFPIFFKLVPIDGFWRAHYLLQYPVFYIIACGLIWHFFQKKKPLMTGGLGVIVGVLALCGMNVFSLQSAWGYPQHYKLIHAPKLDHTNMDSVLDAASTCKSLHEGGVILAPEAWEIVAQMLYPQSTSIAARHMAHNFNNAAPDSDFTLNEANRNRAVAYVANASAQNLDEDALINFWHVVDLGVTIIASPANVLSKHQTEMKEKGFSLISSVNAIDVYCR